MTYRNHWLSLLNQWRTAYHRALFEDPFKGWEKNRMPEISAEQELYTGLQIMYAEANNVDARLYMARCVLIAARAIDDQKTQSKWGIGSYPLNRGQLLRAKSYAQCFLGLPLEVDAMRQASIDLEEWCKDKMQEKWDSQTQAYYLGAVRVALLTDDLERATQMLRIRKQAKWHREEQRLLQNLTESPGAASSGKLASEFDELLNKVRNPTEPAEFFRETNFLCLELAVLRGKFLNNERSINWRQVIEVVSA